jgi:hypothetical protein
MKVVYAYRTAKAQGGYASVVTLTVNDCAGHTVSYAVHPTRQRAYRYARHMAAVMARNASLNERRV